MYACMKRRWLRRMPGMNEVMFIIVVRTRDRFNNSYNIILNN